MDHDQGIVQGSSRTAAAKARGRFTQRTRYQQFVTRLSAATQHCATTGAFPNDRDRDRHIARARQVAPHNGALDDRRGGGNTSVQSFKVGPRRRTDRDYGAARSPTHRREVRQRCGNCLETQIFQGKEFAIEMNSQYGYISTDQGLADKGRQNRCVVADVDLTWGNNVPTHDCGDTLQ